MLYIRSQLAHFFFDRFTRDFSLLTKLVFFQIDKIIKHNNTRVRYVVTKYIENDVINRDFLTFDFFLTRKKNIVFFYFFSRRFQLNKFHSKNNNKLFIDISIKRNLVLQSRISFILRLLQQCESIF